MASPLTLQASLRPPTWFTGERAQSRSNSQDQFHPRCLRNAVYPVYPSSFLAPKSSQVAGFKVDHSTDGEEGLSAGSLDPRETSANDMLTEQDKGDWYLVKCSRAGFVALAAAALCYSGPALAYKGGGPYGIQVTRGQDLSGQDFSGKTLIKQDFKTSILRQANFKGAKLLGASFFDADLTGADLSDSDLRGADFSLAQVQKANLSNAVLEGALVTGNTSFKNSNITGADFTDVYWREDQKSYLCQVASGVNPVTGNATRETLLCDD